MLSLELVAPVKSQSVAVTQSTLPGQLSAFWFLLPKIHFLSTHPPTSPSTVSTKTPILEVVDQQSERR